MAADTASATTASRSGPEYACRHLEGKHVSSLQAAFHQHPQEAQEEEGTQGERVGQPPTIRRGLAGG
jgi:hypothetical protein